MTQLVSTWSALTPLRQGMAVAAAVLALGLVLLLSRLATAPDFTLLYAGLEPAAAGEVVAVLEERGIPHQVRGGAIYVDATARDPLRLSLAAEGLPANGTAGYELLDGLSGFGTTAQMFDAAYWRAKEGELARTLAASPGIRSARVHLATPPTTSFRRDLAPSASVALTPSGGGIDPEQARAVRFLVASAVAGLRPENVSVIDAATGRVLNPDPVPSGADRAAELRGNIERLLSARVGPGRAVVEVSVETATDREQIVERRLDPQGRVAISQETEEQSRQSTDQRPGAVTVASNLPEGDTANGGQSSARDSETRERINFEVSETSREILREPGSVRRITVAVLVDGITTTAEDGTTSWQPLPDAELLALRDLVASAAGIDESRGDIVTLRSLPFEVPAESGTMASGGLLDDLDVMQLLQIAILALVVLILGLFVVRPILAPRRLPAPAGVGGTAPPAPPALTGEIQDGPSTSGLPDDGELRAVALTAPLPALPPDSPHPRRPRLPGCAV